jgi:hypothetical protein
MDAQELRRYAEQTRERVATTASLSERNTQLRLVQPFLEALGWSLERIVAEYEFADAGGESVDFALLVEKVPEIVVETRACSEDLREADVEALGSILIDTDVDWGILTNGRQFVFAGVDGTGTLERRPVELDGLHDRMDVVSRYTERVASRRVERRKERYSTAVERLESDRQAIHDDLTDRLVATTGDDFAPMVEEATERFLDDLLDAFRERQGNNIEHHGNGTDIDSITDSPSVAAGRPDTPGAEQNAQEVSEDEKREHDSSTSAQDVSGIDELETPEIESETPPELDSERDTGGDSESNRELALDVEREEEFVVRFFDGGTSVGAVGHRNAATATRLAVEYLLEHRQLEGSISLPWGPESEGPILRHGDSGPSITVENGWQLDTSCSVPTARAAIEALADESGLRTMFQGNWSDGE